MKTKNTRRKFLKKGAAIGLGCGFTPGSLFAFSTKNITDSQHSGVMKLTVR